MHQLALDDSHGALGVNVRDVGCDTWGHADIIEGELADPWVQLQQQRERLTDTTGGTEDGDLGVLHHQLLAYSQRRSEDLI